MINITTDKINLCFNVLLHTRKMILVYIRNIYFNVYL